jgi:hypothetical protein
LILLVLSFSEIESLGLTGGFLYENFLQA